MVKINVTKPINSPTGYQLPLPHISVCVCTYRRPLLLSRLLDRLTDMSTGGRFSYSVVIVDNDPDRTAENIAEKVLCGDHIDGIYLHESRLNIALARNRALENAVGDYCAFIDDDEIPQKNWLLELYLQAQRTGATAVLGPVENSFDRSPQKWILESGVFSRSRYPSGRRLHWRQTRTGNVLLRRKFLNAHKVRFNPKFGVLGGEDIMFFKNLLALPGAEAVWCDSAVVHEIVPASRATFSSIRRRATNQGRISFRYLEDEMDSILRLKIALKAVAAVSSYTLYTGTVGLVRYSIGMKYLIKMLHHVNRFAAACGFPDPRERGL